MANITIFGLPEQTGKTNDDVLAIVDSGNTTTSKIKVSTLLSNSSPITFATGTTSYKSINIPDNEIQGNNSIYIGNNLYSNDGIRSTGGANLLIGNGDISSGANNAIFGASDGLSKINVSPYGGAVVIQTGNIAGSGFRGGALYHAHDVDYNGGQYAVGMGGYFWDINGDGCFGACNAAYTSVGGNYSVLISSQGSVSGNNSAKIAGGSGNVSGDGSGVFVGSNGRITSNSAGILAGTNITITGASTESVAIGGNGNTISASTQSGMVGGDSNGISGSTRSVIIGGSGNTINTKTNSVILGGSGLTSNENNEVLVQNLKVSGQTSGNFYDHLSGDTFDINGNLGNLHRISMTGDSVIQLSNFKTGGVYSVSVENTGSYVYTLIFDADSRSVLFAGGVPTPTPNGLDLLVFEVHGGNILGRNFADFQ